jgi:hypothetical protein
LRIQSPEGDEIRELFLFISNDLRLFVIPVK